MAARRNLKKPLNSNTAALVLFSPSCLCVLVAKTRTLQLSSALYKSPLFMQNKANFKIGKMNISTATLKAYANKQRTMNNERYSKQTQSKPILPPQNAIRPTWRRAVIRCIMICEKQCQSVLIPMGPWVRVKKQNRSV